MKNEDVNSRVYALIQLSGHSPKTVSLPLCCNYPVYKCPSAMGGTWPFIRGKLTVNTRMSDVLQLVGSLFMLNYKQTLLRRSMFCKLG